MSIATATAIAATKIPLSHKFDEDSAYGRSVENTNIDGMTVDWRGKEMNTERVTTNTIFMDRLKLKTNIM